MICMNHYIIFGYVYKLMEIMLHKELQQLKSRYPDRGSARGLFTRCKRKII